MTEQRTMRRLKAPTTSGATKFRRKGKHLASLLFGMAAIYGLAGIEYGDLSSYISDMKVAPAADKGRRRKRDFYFSPEEAERISGEEPHSHTYIKRTGRDPGSRNRPQFQNDENDGETAGTSEAPRLPLPASEATSTPEIVLPPLPANVDSSSKNEIPRLLHYIWPDKNFSTGFEGDQYKLERKELISRVDNIKALNPLWETHVWTDAESEELLRRYYPEFYPIWKKKLRPKLKMFDAVRPAILHTYGGIYLDHDIECIGVGFDEWIDRSDSSKMKTKLLVRSPRVYSRYTALGNHFMGSVPGHAIWGLYIDNIIKGLSSKRRRRTVTGHTGPGMFGRTYEQYLEMNPDEKMDTSIHVLDLNELANTGECEENESYGLLNATLCVRPRCIHQRGISPAEIAGEDDNSAKQVAAVKARSETTKGIDDENGTLMELAGNMEQTYTVPNCNPCDRMRRFRLRTKGRAVFVHLPKTAGSTIEYILGVGGSCHATASALEACKPEMYRSALTFTVIRNPLDRVISMYDYARAGGNGKEGDAAKYAWVKNSTTFEEFVNGLDPFDYSYSPMAHYLYDDMYNNSSAIGVKEVLCFDNLTAGWNRLASMESSLQRDSNGKEVNLTATHRRVGRHSVTALSQTTMDKIGLYYREDFKLWDKYCDGRDSQILPHVNINATVQSKGNRYLAS